MHSHMHVIYPLTPVRRINYSVLFQSSDSMVDSSLRLHSADAVWFCTYFHANRILNVSMSFSVSVDLDLHNLFQSVITTVLSIS